MDDARTHARPHGWLDDQTRAHLQVLAEGVATLAGFEQAAITLRRRDGVFEVVAAAGVTPDYVGTEIPRDVVEAEIEASEDWGVWRFVDHEVAEREMLSYSHIPDLEPVDGDDAWHPLDSLFAPLHDAEGGLRGLFAVDSPSSGRRPTQQQLQVLTGYAGLARTLIHLALEREELAEKVRMADEAREIVRRALGEPTLAEVLAACRSTVVDCFDAVGLWFTVFDDDGGMTTVSFNRGAELEAPFQQVDDPVRSLALRYWDEQYVAAFSGTRTVHPGLSPEDADRYLGLLAELDVGAVLFVPLGVGTECLGFLILTRATDAADWSQVELDAALDIGQDLGRAVANARQRERERLVIERLQRLDGYRVEVVNTLGHELRNPLFSMSANLELVDLDELEGETRRSVEAASRGVRRMRTVIEDMLTMAQMSDPRREFDPVEVDLRRVAQDVLDECVSAAGAAAVSCRMEAPDEPALVLGRADEVHRMLTNLVTNAIKYTDPGGRVDLRVRHHGSEVVVEVADTGIGISEEDQERVFHEFFRSTNPSALVRPGTGLGLAIVARIVDRHGGSVDLESARGRGTTVVVRLPAMVSPSAATS